MKKIALLGLASLSLLTTHAQNRSQDKAQTKSWWKETLIYQVYPRSFKDADGDGIGDLNGIRQQLDYLRQLGVGTVWINPFCKSPGADNGYDVSDYRAIDPIFGTMDDFNALLTGLRKGKMHLVMDMVLNHTSEEHPWFREARKSRTNPYHDYYIWLPGKKDSLPNNWPGIFGGSAWQWNEATQEYYLHTFLDKQPDLNWDNPRLRQELYSVMRFWLDKGVDGFRFDAISLISKNKHFPNLDYSHGLFAALDGVINNGPHLHEYLREMNDSVLGPYHAYSVGEVYTDKASAWKFVAPERHELSTIYCFDILQLSGENKLLDVKQILSTWDSALRTKDSWNTVVLSNHDFPRALSRLVSDPQHRPELAKMLATLLLTGWGTPFLYQGDELGMTNYPFRSMAEIKDITAQAQYAALIKQGMPDSTAFRQISRNTRDNARTPMQWASTKNGGFTTGDQPWIGVNPNYRSINAAAEQVDPASILNFYRRLIAIRQSHPALIYGNFYNASPKDSTVFQYTRQSATEKWLIVINLTATATPYRHDHPAILSSYPSTDKSFLQPYESRLYHLGK